MADYSNAMSSGSYANADSYSSLFEPDVVLPSQFLASDEQGLSGGERKLMAALLSDGIEAYISQCTSAKYQVAANGVALVAKRRGKIDAREWVDTKDHAYVFSFDNVCECLGIDPEYLRLGLGRYVEAINTQRKSGDGPKTVWKKIRRPRKQ